MAKRRDYHVEIDGHRTRDIAEQRTRAEADEYERVASENLAMQHGTPHEVRLVRVKGKR